jgi:polyphosphate kinase
MKRKAYRKIMYGLFVELVKLQRHFIDCDDSILIILEGRDAAGKDGAIKRLIKHLSPRDTRVVALGKPSDRDRRGWYFQRFVPHLPVAGELVVFNRSWYNRAGVERVMGFCTEGEYQEFLETVPQYEDMLVRAGIRLLKYYFDISRPEQARRLQVRREDPLKQWKVSPIDEQALANWDGYTSARNEMLARTHSAAVPWTVVAADNKRRARVNFIRDVLDRLHYCDKDPALILPDPEVRLSYDGSKRFLRRLAV